MQLASVSKLLTCSGRAQGLRRGASAIKCYYAARGISTTAVAGLRVPANAIASGSINIDRDVGVHTKISLSVSRRVVSPACIAGVLVSRPNFNALCGRTKL